MKQLHFHALREDLLPVLQALERLSPLKYVQCGNFIEREYKSYSEAVRIPNLGIATHDTGSVCDAYLMTTADMAVNVRTVIGARNEPRYCIDQLINPDTVVIRPAGLWGQEILLEGCAGTASASELSKELMKRLGLEMRKRFVKVRAFWVGPAALNLLDAGKRLTISARSPRDFDLTKIVAAK